jgi:RimJ/RimL family protein N-acetyltransferase
MTRGESFDLRAVERADAGALHRWLNDPAVASFFARQLAPASGNEVQRRIEEWLHRETADGRTACLIAVSLDGDPFGAITVRHDEERHRAIEAELLFSTASDLDALIRDALLTFAETCFAQWNLHRIDLRLLADESRWRAIAEACGFRLDALLREAAFLDGRYQDVALYSRLASDSMPGDEGIDSDE